jgi:hypothetical protein
MLEESKNKKTSSRDLISPNKKEEPKEQIKKISSNSNDIIERLDQKVVIEDGRELLK